jgi:Tfp pilus assembly protein PilZ
VKKRSCDRFSIPGTVLYYKVVPRFFGDGAYTDNYYPVINMSRGGAMFVCDQRFEAGTQLMVRLMIPGNETEPELRADVRWIAKNPEQSYRYRTGIAFSAYGSGKKQNPEQALDLLKQVEIRAKNS